MFKSDVLKAYPEHQKCEHIKTSAIDFLKNSSFNSQ